MWESFSLWNGKGWYNPIKISWSILRCKRVCTFVRTWTKRSAILFAFANTQNKVIWAKAWIQRENMQITLSFKWMDIALLVFVNNKLKQSHKKTTHTSLPKPMKKAAKARLSHSLHDKWANYTKTYTLYSSLFAVLLKFNIGTHNLSSANELVDTYE